MKKLIVPVYLNQRMVFDQIAMLKGGISTVTSVTHSESDSDSSQSGVSAEVGSGGILSSFFKVNLTGKMTNADSQHSEYSSSDNRVHTPASLFYELRNQLEEENVLLSLTEGVPKTGSFVEFKCQLKNNPLLESLESAVEIGNLINMFIENSADNPQKATRKRSRNRRKNQDRQNQSPQNQIPQNNELTIQETMMRIQQFITILKQGNTLDLVGLKINGSISAVITLEDRFLNDPQMSDLLDGEFNVVGVVVKSINNHSDSISLVRKTTFSKLPPNVIDPLIEGLDEFQSHLGIESSSIDVEISGPAIQVLPIAIFA